MLQDAIRLRSHKSGSVAIKKNSFQVMQCKARICVALT